MGAAASFQEQPEHIQKEIYRKIAQLYDEEYLPKLQNNDIKQGEGFSMFRKRFEQLVADIPVYLDHKNDTDITNLDESKSESKLEQNKYNDIPENKSESKITQHQDSYDSIDNNGNTAQNINNKNENNNKDNNQNNNDEKNNHKERQKRLSDFYTTFMVGDIVKVRQGFMMFEGVVVDAGNETLDVDFGDDIEKVPVETCCLVMNGLDFEVGDYVSACPAGDLYFNGKIVSINTNGTFDILFDGDDPEDVEHNIRPDKVRKIRTGRQLVINRWQRAKQLISMGIAWASLGHGNNSSTDGDSKNNDDYDDDDGIKYPAESKNNDLTNFESKFDEKFGTKGDD